MRKKPKAPAGRIQDEGRDKQARPDASLPTPKVVYIAGPYTNGDPAVNVKRAIDTADFIMLHPTWKLIPFVPHLCHLWHLAHPHGWETWMEYSEEFLKRSDAVLRLPGKSKGADKEVKLAKKLKKPVYYSLAELAENEADRR